MVKARFLGTESAGRTGVYGVFAANFLIVIAKFLSPSYQRVLLFAILENRDVRDQRLFTQSSIADVACCL